VEKHVQSQRRRAVQIKRHHKKVVEAYENFENISQVINLKSIDLEFCGHTRVYPKVSRLATKSENCKWYSSLPLGAVVFLFCELV
jgi:hypothetical protein